jgi:hypothetical protein
VPLGAGDHRRIGKVQVEIGIAADQSPDTGKVVFAAVESVRAGREVIEEGFHRGKWKSSFEHIRDFGQNSRRNDIRAALRVSGPQGTLMVRVSPLDNGVQD